MSNSFNSRQKLTSGGKEYTYFDLNEAGKSIGKDFSRLPFSLKVILENLLK